MGEFVLWGVAVAVAAVVAFMVGRGQGSRSGREAGLKTGRDEGIEEGRRLEGEATAKRLESASQEVDGLRKRSAHLEIERDQAADAALARVAEYLDSNVAAPLGTGLAGGALKPAAKAALDAVEDLQFFIRRLDLQRETCNLVTLVQDTAREFTQDWDLPVRISAPSGPLRADVARETLKDALFLILANVGHFGDGGGAEVSLDEVEGSSRILIRDRGPGFSAEALERGMDPFYTTRPGGLGLGLPFAGRIVRELDGQLALRNRPEGGAEVEIRFPRGR